MFEEITAQNGVLDYDDLTIILHPPLHLYAMNTKPTFLALSLDASFMSH